MKCEFQIEGMHCPACEILIKNEVEEIKGVSNVHASLTDNKLTLEIAEEQPNLRDAILKKIEPHGYTFYTGKKSLNFNELWISGLIALIILGAFQLLQNLGLIESFNPSEINYFAIFTIGILASLSSCMAVVGSLILSLTKSRDVWLFHISRIASFFVLGGILGLLGSGFRLKPQVFALISLITFSFMIINGLTMVFDFKILRKISLKMPTFIADKANTDKFGALTLGLLSFFLPCGFTQSMQLYALSSGSVVQGALTMLVFALGTFPALAILSVLSTKLSSGKYSGYFYKVAGIMVLYFSAMGIYSLAVQYLH